MLKTKVCGITRIDDAISAVEAGAYAIGFIFYPKSPRYISPDKAKIISDTVKTLGAVTIGVFVNEDADIVNKIAEEANLDYVQLHGFESAECCDKIKLPYIKNIRDISQIDTYKNAEILMIDAPDTSQWGGTGEVGDWRLAKAIKHSGRTLMLSGGISIDNVENAVNFVKPDIIDVSSSLESSKGIKDINLITEFFNKLRTMEINYDDND